MEEQISVGEGRIEVTEYDGKSNMSSYIVCVDRESVNDVDYLDNFTEYTRRMTSKVEVKYPGAKKLTPEITDHISRDFSKFEKSLYSYDYKSKRYGYGDFIDIDNFVDYYIINEVTQKMCIRDSSHTGNDSCTGCYFMGDSSNIRCDGFIRG